MAAILRLAAGMLTFVARGSNLLRWRGAALAVFLLSWAASPASAQNYTFDARRVALGGMGGTPNLASKLVERQRRYKSVLIPVGLVRVLSNVRVFFPNREDFDFSRAVDRAIREHELARFHRVPPPMFMATARIDAIWVHDGILDARDYKTGSLWHTRVADVPAAKVQAFVLAQAAAQRDLRLRLRYEYLQPEIADDPEPWEPYEDDLALVEIACLSALGSHPLRPPRSICSYCEPDERDRILSFGRHSVNCIAGGLTVAKAGS